MELKSPVPPAQESVLTPAALTFLSELERAQSHTRQVLLRRRRIVQSHLEEGRRLVLADPPARPSHGEWQAASPPSDLRSLRLGIHGPAHRDFLVPALESQARLVMADVAESLSTSWEHVLEAHADVCESLRGLSGRASTGDRMGGGTDLPAALAIRPRGLGTDEPGLEVDGEPIAAATFDAGLYLFHNARELHQRGQAPALVIAGVQVGQEAAWWSEMCARAEAVLGLPEGTVRVILRQDEVLGAFDLDEILWEFRDRVVAVTLHRTGYLASWLRCLGHEFDRLLPDPCHIGPDSRLVTDWRRLVMRTAQDRGIRVLGERSERLPMKQPEASPDKEGRRVQDRVIVPFVREVFDAFETGFPRSMQDPIDRCVDIRDVTAADLLRPPSGTCTLAGLLHNLELIVRWEDASLRGRGSVRVGQVRCDAADVELATRHVVQWLWFDIQLEDGSVVNPELIERELPRAVARLHANSVPEELAENCFAQAARSVHLQLADLVSR